MTDLAAIKKISLDDFMEIVEHCPSRIKDQAEAIYQSAVESIKTHKNKEPDPAALAPFLALQDRWYGSLPNKPDYSVYDDSFYLADIWACWVCYSRNSVKSVAAKGMVDGKSILELTLDSSCIVDLGCGFGLTTAALKQVFPEHEVFGTNLESSFQYKAAEHFSREFDFTLLSDFKGLKKEGLVFASEYFEHFERPVEHLYEVIEALNPKYMVTANGFNGTAIGHFDHYKHLKADKIPARDMSRFFNKCMRHFGYEKAKTKIWNGRPAFWVKK